LFASRSSFADWYQVPTGSMLPTIVEGDRIFVNKMAYRLEVPFTDIEIRSMFDAYSMSKHVVEAYSD
jgi:signal peptidase I